MNSLRGQFLVASPHLADPNFSRTVVLIIQHDESGALGLILNRPTGKSMRDVWKLVSEEPCECDSPIFLGGPVRGPLAALHTHGEHANLEVVEGVYYTVEDKSLSDVIRQDRDSFHIFIGYSGWAPGQLESELEAGGWLITSAEEADVFRPPYQLWPELTRRIGREILLDTVRPKIVPDDPSLN